MASKEMEQLKLIMKQMMLMEGMPAFRGSINPLKLREQIERSQSMMYVDPRVSFEEVSFGGILGERGTPKEYSNDCVIIYIHGGGMICGTAKTSRGYAALLASETNYVTYTLTYRLAPEHKYPAGVNDAFDFYQAVLKKHPMTPIFLIGESGGAYLCLTTTILAKKSGLRLPNGIIPYSPPVDMTGTLFRNQEYNQDYVVTPDGLSQLKELFCPNATNEDELVSPILADFTGFPPMFLAWDKTETLATDSEELKKRAELAGVIVEGKGYDDCFHSFATTGKGTPESLEVLNNTIAFIHRYR